MERTFSFDARAVVPTTLGFTSAMPSAEDLNGMLRGYDVFYGLEFLEFVARPGMSSRAPDRIRVRGVNHQVALAL